MISIRAMGRDGATLRVLDWDGSSLVAGPLGGADPLGFAAGDANLYRYVGNDPTGTIDPSGLAPDKSTIIEIAKKIIEELKELRDFPDRELPDGTTINGPCGSFAHKMAAALNAKKISGSWNKLGGWPFSATSDYAVLAFVVVDEPPLGADPWTSRSSI